MVRFSRDKRFFLPVSFDDYQMAVVRLIHLVQEHVPHAEFEVLTCEDMSTYNYATVTFYSDEVMEVLNKRKKYRLGELTPRLWRRSYMIEMAVRDPSTEEPFVIWLSVNRQAESNRLMFYYNHVSDALEADLASFRRPSLLFGIGNGYSKSTDFNLGFGQRLTGHTFS